MGTKLILITMGLFSLFIIIFGFMLFTVHKERLEAVKFKEEALHNKFPKGAEKVKDEEICYFLEEDEQRFMEWLHAEKIKQHEEKFKTKQK